MHPYHLRVQWIRIALGYLRLLLTPFAGLESVWAKIAFAITLASGATVAIGEWDWLADHRPFWIAVFVGVLFAISSTRLYYQNNRQISVSVVPMEPSVVEFQDDYYRLWILRLQIKNDGSRPIKPEFRVLRAVAGIEDADYGDFPLDLEYVGNEPMLHGQSSATLRLAWARFNRPKKTFLFVKGSEGMGHWKELNLTDDEMVAYISMRDLSTGSVRTIRVLLSWDGELPQIEAKMDPVPPPVLYTP